MWNYTWQTGLDRHGEPIPNSMYDHLYTNTCKETCEYPYYTFQDHWNLPATPSYPPRTAMRSYIEGHFRKLGGKIEWIKFNTVVKRVSFDKETQLFTVITRNYSQKQEYTDYFDYVICATGHFSYPSIDPLPCFKNYTGTIIHSHDQRTFSNYKNKTVLVIGTKFSAEDIAAISYKFGAKKVICCH